MGRRKSDEVRLYGPHFEKSRDCFGYKIATPDGEISRFRCRRGATKEEASEEARGALNAYKTEHCARDVRDAVADYASHLEKIGDKKETAAWVGYASKELVDRFGDDRVYSLRSRHLDRYLKSLSDRSLATQRSYWRAIVRMCDFWAIKAWTEGDIAQDLIRKRKKDGLPFPWQTANGKKQIGRGKKQLRSEAEARRYIVAALEIKDGERRAAAILPLLTGIASGELRNLTAGQIDVEGATIWINDDDQADGWTVKTAARRRVLPIPAVILPELAALVANKPAEALVFTQRSNKGGQIKGSARGKHWLLSIIRGVCEAAGVRVVTAHGLRGTYASLLVANEQRAIAEVALALGHSDKGKTAARAYVGSTKRRPSLRLID